MSDVLKEALGLCEPESIEAARISVNLYYRANAPELIQGALSVAHREGNHRLEVSALISLMNTDGIYGRMEDRKEKLERVLELCHEYGMRYEIPDLLAASASGFVRKDHSEWERRMTLAVNAATELGMRSTESGFYAKLGIGSKNSDQQIEYLERALNAAPNMTAAVWLSGSQMQRGQHDLANDILREAVAGLHNQELLPEQNDFLFFIARRARNTNDPRVLEYLEDAIQACPPPPEEVASAFVIDLGSRAICAALQGDFPAAESYTNEISRVIEEHDIRKSQIKFITQIHFYPLALCAEASGDFNSAIEHLEVILTTSEDPDFWILCAEMYLDRGMPGDVECARERLNTAQVNAGSNIQIVYAERLEAMFERIEKGTS